MEPGPDMLLIGSPQKDPAVWRRRSAEGVAQTQQRNRNLVLTRLSALAPVFAELGIPESHVHPQHSTGIILVSGLSGKIKETLRNRVEELNLLGGDDATTKQAAKKK